MYAVSAICRIVGGRFAGRGDREIVHLLYDSRRVQQPASSLFFALKTDSSNGHHYLHEAYEKGVRAFVVSEPFSIDDGDVITVANTLEALQALAAWHRSQFTLPVIGITGSNGKTVVKEWLNQLLEDDYSIVRSPKSFNSQLGVPLSVWEIGPQHTLGIFEAGISQPGEMVKAEKVIRPTIGVLTNLGEAHSEGFASADEKLQEKSLLFRHCEVVIGEKRWLQQVDRPTLTWSRTGEADVKITRSKGAGGKTTIHALYKQKTLAVELPFADEAALENAITCLCVLLYLGTDVATFSERFSNLHSVDMRLQLQHAINNCLLINDSYSADLTSLRIALHFLNSQSSGRKRTVILSEFAETGKADAVLYTEIAGLLIGYAIDRVIAIGEKMGAFFTPALFPGGQVQRFSSTAEFIGQFRSSQFSGEIILLKGARRFGFESIASLFEQKLHGTVLQINLTALAHNLREYQRRLKPATKIMAMVKAFSYGSGGAEIAAVLQYNKVDYLGVAYADEGIELVKAGITLPVMVLNPEAASYGAILEYNLQPVLYSMALLRDFEAYTKAQGLTAYPVHLEVETGMNRLGFAVAEMEAVAGHLAGNTTLRVQSLFSHLAGSEDPAQDSFTQVQQERFSMAASALSNALPYPFLKHLANSAAIVRHPHLQFDMVRLGIGLYGIEPDKDEALQLEPVATLLSTVAQIKEVKKGESISYNRRSIVQRDSRIATVRIGYADGYSRRLGNGAGRMWVRGQLVPVVGTVCMDMTMIDVTDVEGVQEGDDVIVFGKELPVQDVAAWEGTIPYEILTSVSQRVKRVYYYE